ncbi:NACHT domain-containing NTPase [Nitrosomonas sp.]|uniref:NACHT domain-containing protein n=1 Tax=Nitrosomonas sp. TaxID=42353 RepID=UPI00272F8116|nr:hypothetical protein [Nitrosomonas sp.]MDP2224789.1 hypothetical protein [Nitrosomonas sp.]
MHAAKSDVTAFRNARDWPPYTIALNLTLEDSGSKLPVTLNGIAAAIGVTEGINIVSAPGTGKGTTLVQLAERIIEAGRFLPLIIPLGEWSDRTDDFFDFVNRRNAFSAFRRQHFMQLAHHGRLVLMLDGWNELDPGSRTRAIRDLQALRRDYPQIATVIGTRQYALPIEGAVIEIEPLSEHQQLEIARAQRGNDGEALVDKAWRSPGVRELIAIPLYLNALLVIPSGSLFPQTKEEVLRMFVMTHEQIPENAEILRKELFGFHKDMLVGLAAQANRSANTSIPETSARQAVSAVEARLSTQCQLSVLPQPTQAIDVLVGRHILVRSASGAGSVMFQHQQFQEWYASYEAEQLMCDAASGSVDALNKLREEVLDWPAWEESILFACERLSRNAPRGTEAVAKAIQESVGIDPMLAAEMINRSTAEVWSLVMDRIVTLVNRWHTPGKIDRGIRFMITTGQPEFAERVWSLVSNEVGQTHLSALRASERFRPGVLGKDAPTKLAGLPDKIRKQVISEIASNSGYDGMDLAASLAKIDPNPEVVVGILQALAFRRADRHVTEILRTASDSVWQKMAHEGYPNDFSDELLQKRFVALREVIVTDQNNPLQILNNLLSDKSNATNVAERVAGIIRSSEFPIKDNSPGNVFHRAYKAFPEQVTEALVFRVGKGLEIPYNAAKYLENAQPIDDGPVVAVALDDMMPLSVRSAALAIVGAKTVGAIMDELFALNEEYTTKDWKIDEADRNKYHRVNNALLTTRLDSFLEAIFERATTERPERICLMADLLARHGKSINTEKFILKDQTRNRLTTIILCWIDILLTPSKITRHQLSKVVQVIQRLGSQQFVAKLKLMLDHDLSDRAQARDEYLQTQRSLPCPDVSHSYSYTNLYQSAFAAIGGEEVVSLMKQYLPNLEFGIEAAQVLVMLWDQAHPSGKEKQLFSWHDFSDVAEHWKQRQDLQNPPTTTDYSEAIFETVRKIANEAQNDTERRHAITLGKIGLHIPHGSKRLEIDKLLQLPLPYSSKQGLLAATAKAGEMLNADMLLAGLQELLEAGKKDSWKLEENHGELMGWIELFAFSDRPDAVIGALDLVPSNYRNPWNLRRLLVGFGHSPHPEAMNTLAEIARRDARFLSQYEWLSAMVKFGTEAAALALLDHVCDGLLAERRSGIDAWCISNYLEGFAREFPAFRSELVQRYARLASGPAQQILERTLANVADGPTILAIIANHAASRRTFQHGQLRAAIDNVAIGRRSVEDWSGAFQEYSIPLTDLRKKLFGLVLAENDQSALAEACLNYIEQLRDEHGRINDEPRHPDIRTGRSWPIVCS